MKYFYYLLFALLLCGCQETKKEKISRLVNEWENKEILFPKNSFFTIFAKDTIAFDTVDCDYKVFTYIDSTGCTSCKLQLLKWKGVIAKFDSLTHNNTAFLFYFHPKSAKEIAYILKRDNFNYPVCIDDADSINKLNQFSDEMMFQTFLLDKENKVLAIGNPVHNPKIEKLYLKLAMGESYTDKPILSQTKISVDKEMINLGTFDWQKKQQVAFTIRNEGDQLLVINGVTTSCGCVSTEYNHEPVQKGKNLKIQVSYKADHAEHFDKTITIYCNVPSSPVKLRIKGDARK
ncbi:DUF1573 domain-containing protein [uncultured Bacteroides sp.]|uniref:DUF1573 domain-containing protein n=1 Tax=uncultured Bacteroides sp. TaxID=162156 RepID=UPI002AABB909|nr:DUF1573 domain-containing protein [uncultured Bacteroides sp.]